MQGIGALHGPLKIFRCGRCWRSWPAVGLARQATPSSVGKGPRMWFCGRQRACEGDGDQMDLDPNSTPAFSGLFVYHQYI